MQLIKDIRVIAQQLGSSQFSSPRDLVARMGAIQAQDYAMAKWAVGIRLKSATDKMVETAFNKGEILRTHVMRPTWHFVAAEDIRWMLKLSAERIKQSSVSRDRDLEITESLYTKVNGLLEKILQNNNYLTREDVGQELVKAGIAIDTSRMIHFMMRAEVEGIVCSGPVRGKKQTYALIEERVVPVADLSKDEALASLASKYFRSHSPAGLQDFVWWSGLSVADARRAIDLIRTELIVDRFASQNLLIHQSLGSVGKIADSLRFLPAFDEYVISYKDRTSVLALEHHPGAFTKNGIFYPIVMYKGQVVGSWKKSVKKKILNVDTSFFESDFEVQEDLRSKAENDFRYFMEA